MVVIDVGETVLGLAALFDLVEAGQEVVHARGGVQMTRLVPVEPTPQRAPGLWRSLPGWESFRYDPALFAPMDDQEIEAEGWA